MPCDTCGRKEAEKLIAVFWEDGDTIIKVCDICVWNHLYALQSGRQWFHSLTVTRLA